MNAQFSKIEKLFARLLSALPFLKRYLKFFYQFINSLIYKPNKPFDTELKVRRWGQPNCDSFFGYYDKYPLNQSNRKVIFHEFNGKTCVDPAVAKGQLDVVIYDLDTKVKLFSIRSRAFNWQQGARAHWLSDDQFIFNDYQDGSYCAVICSASKCGVEKVLPRPVYDSYKDLFFLSTGFLRLSVLNRDYGYFAHTPSQEDFATDSGIWKVDIKTGSEVLVFSYEDLKKWGHESKDQDRERAFNHIMISPNGENAIVTERSFINGIRQDRLFLFRTNGSKQTLLLDTGMVSHCCWVDDLTIFGFWRNEDGTDCFNKLSIYDHGSKSEPVKILDVYGDGHPTSTDGSFFFDSYPDRGRVQHLYKFKGAEVISLGSFYSTLQYRNEWRCDLHPRASISHSIIWIDSAHDGRRGLFSLE